MFREKTVKPKTIGNIASRHTDDSDEDQHKSESDDAKKQPSKANWFTRAAEKISSAASKVTAKTASLLDFNTGAADVIFVSHKLKVVFYWTLDTLTSFIIMIIIKAG
jgi:hypothetical protein